MPRPLILISGSTEKRGQELADFSLSLSLNYPLAVQAGGGMPWVLPCIPSPDFLADSVAGLGSVWLATHWPAILEAEAYAQRAATSAQPVPFAFFTDAQAADIDAMSSQIFPATDTPGAHEAHVVNFIDRESQKSF